MTSTTAALALIIVGILIALAMILTFLWRVYDRGGPKDALDAARALREVYDPNWPANLLRFLPATGEDDEEKSA